MKVPDQCQFATCNITRCDCQLECNLFALIQVMVLYQDQLPSLRGTAVTEHMVEATTRIIALPLDCILEKCMLDILLVIWPME